METTEKQALFWDVNLKEIDPEKHRNFIVQRILSLGDADDLKWAIEKYGKKTVSDIFSKNYRKMDSKSANFWFTYFNLEKNAS